MDEGGQAMVEFAMVLPILLMIIFIIVAVSFIYAVRIGEHRIAYDAARHVAKENIGAFPSDRRDMQAEALTVIHEEYQASQLLKYFTAHEPDKHDITVGPGPHGSGGEDLSTQAVEVTITYNLVNVPGWDQLAALNGARSQNQLTERSIAARVAGSF